MPLNLDNKVSSDDLARRNSMVNGSSFASGFESESSDNSGFGGSGMLGEEDDFSMDDLFGNEDEGFGSFGGSNNNSFGSNSGGFVSRQGQQNNTFGNNSGFGQPSNTFGQQNNAFGQQTNAFGGTGSAFGSSNGFGNSAFGQTSNAFGSSSFGNNGFGGFGQQNSTFGGFGQQPQFGQNQMQAQQQQKPDMLDNLLNVAEETANGLGSIFMTMIKSFKDRSADDYGFFGRNLILTGVGLIIGSIVVGIIGSIIRIKFIGFNGIIPQFIFSGALSLCSGITMIGAAALVLTRLGEDSAGALEGIQDIPEAEDNVTKTYEDNIGDELDDLFSDDFDELFDKEFGGSEEDIFGSDSEPEKEEEDEPDVDIDVAPVSIDWDAKLSEVNSNSVMTRQSLFEQFKPMLPISTPGFAESTEINPSSDTFAQLETICFKALANVANCELEDIRSSLDSAIDSFFSYTLKLRRINKVKNCDALASELEVYFREDSRDDSVNVTVYLEGDYYKIIVTKGVTAVVSFGDVFKDSKICDYYTNPKHKLPIILGIDELGDVKLEDAKVIDTMMICGRPRSGKSWYVLSILASMMLFNTPEDVQFIIIDPKEAQLFKSISLLPHVCGLHNDKKILSILDDVIEVEAPRRKKLLTDHKCDDIWALRDAGVMLPVLYIVIDEYITVRNNLDSDKQKELNAKIQTIISQLPSQGIRLMFVPHRATGVVDKTNRTMINLSCAIRSNNEDVLDILDIKSWKHALTKPGDIALKSAEMKEAIYVRGAALTTSDNENARFIEMAAKAFYKMGVDIPDMSAMRIACNRDEDYVREQLGGDGKRVQYDASTILQDLDNIDVDD